MPTLHCSIPCWCIFADTLLQLCSHFQLLSVRRSQLCLPVTLQDSLEFACFLCVCIGFLQVLSSHRLKASMFRLIGDSKCLLAVQREDLVTCPGCVPHLCPCNTVKVQSRGDNRWRVELEQSCIWNMDIYWLAFTCSEVSTSAATHLLHPSL